jgi:hypothetical protein
VCHVVVVDSVDIRRAGEEIDNKKSAFQCTAIHVFVRYSQAQLELGLTLLRAELESLWRNAGVDAVLNYRKPFSIRRKARQNPPTYMRAVDAIAVAVGAVAASAISPGCRNLTGFWCCELTNLTQSTDGVSIATRADYGDGIGTLSGLELRVHFSNAASVINGSVSPDCSSIDWTDGAVWTRTAPPWQPAVAPPAWLHSLSSILEINPLAYTSPAGNGTGDGSGTWASLLQKLDHLKATGVGGVWIAYYNLATAHFYGIRSVYAATDPTTLDEALGSVDDFDAFVAACHEAGIRVFLDVIGHGLVNTSLWIQREPDWFAGGSWGMTDFNYSSPGFLAWWATTWTTYVLARGADGFRIDIADPSWWVTGVWDDIASAARAGGREIAVWGEGSRYHFSQHDFIAPLQNVTASVMSARADGHCFNSLQFSCHDHGWQSAPGNYFFLRGSRAHFAYGSLSPFIPLWLGGDEYNEDPVVDLPHLQKDLFGKSGLPGGWMYGSVRDWSQLDDPNGRQAQMLRDTTAILAIQKAHANVLHRNACATDMISIVDRVSVSHSPLPLDPYARFIKGVEAVLVVASTGNISQHIVVDVPLERFGFAGVAFFNVSILFGGDGGSQRLPAIELSSLGLQLYADKTPGGGATVVAISPTA